jgi:hypothetical protein
LSNQWTKKVLFNFVYLLNLLSWFTDTNKGGIMGKKTVEVAVVKTYVIENLDNRESWDLINREETQEQLLEDIKQGYFNDDDVINEEIRIVSVMEEE